jgi:triacylglycerol lipase
MPKPLPPSTPKALDPPPSAAFPYAFFADVAHHPLQPLDSAFNLRNAWWLMDAAFLAYSSEADTRAAYVATRVPVTVRFFVGTLGTQCYVAEAPDWVVLAFRGTQVDDFMASVIDWTVNVRFAPVPDAQEHLVHAGFLNAGTQVWTDVQAHVLALQAERARPFWITGHSLGAALATIAASFAASEPRLMLKGVYTYGSPRVGDAAFGHGVGVPVFRFRNNSDIVTNVPLGLVFRHVGALQHIDSGGHLHEHVQPSEELILKAGAIHLPAGESRALSGLLRTSQPTIPLPGFLADHAPVNYAIRIWNCYEASLGTRS